MAPHWPQKPMIYIFAFPWQLRTEWHDDDDRYRKIEIVTEGWAHGARKHNARNSVFFFYFVIFITIESVVVSSHRMRCTHTMSMMEEEITFLTCNLDLTPSLSEQTTSILFDSISAVWHPEHTSDGCEASGCCWRLHVVAAERGAHCTSTSNSIHSQFMCAYLWLPAASLAALKFQFPAADRKWKFCQITVSAVRDDCEWKIIRRDFLRCQKSIADELNLFSPSNPFNWLESNLICHSIHRSNRNSFKKNLGGPGLLFLRMCNQLLLCMRGLRCGTAVGIVIDIVLSECGLNRRNINNYPSRQVIKLLFTVKTNKEKGERVAGKDLQWW